MIASIHIVFRALCFVVLPASAVFEGSGICASDAAVTLTAYDHRSTDGRVRTAARLGYRTPGCRCGFGIRCGSVDPLHAIGRA